MPNIEINGLDEINARMKKYPQQLRKVQKTGILGSLLALWENVPGYPPPPPESNYVRTGTLGKSLGSSEGGGKSGGEPDIYTSKPISGGYEGHFGSALDYAPHVIGDNHLFNWWWTITTVAERASESIAKIWVNVGVQLKKFLEGKAF